MTPAGRTIYRCIQTWQSGTQQGMGDATLGGVLDMNWEVISVEVVLLWCSLATDHSATLSCRRNQSFEEQPSLHKSLCMACILHLGFENGQLCIVHEILKRQWISIFIVKSSDGVSKTHPLFSHHF